MSPQKPAETPCVVGNHVYRIMAEKVMSSFTVESRTGNRVFRSCAGSAGMDRQAEFFRKGENIWNSY
jgi:hypothetical protein